MKEHLPLQRQSKVARPGLYPLVCGYVIVCVGRESEVRERLIAYSISCWEYTEPQSVPPHVNTRPCLAMARGRGQC